MDPTPEPAPAPARTGPLAGLTRNVFVLGLVSLFTDISSEMIVPVRILFLVAILAVDFVFDLMIINCQQRDARLPAFADEERLPPSRVAQLQER